LVPKPKLREVLIVTDPKAVLYIQKVIDNLQTKVPNERGLLSLPLPFDAMVKRDKHDQGKLK
jgi:hypothetical protein